MLVESQRHDRVLHLTLNRPEKRNALNLQLCRELVTALDKADDDPSIGAILLTANGKVFCAGMDLAEAGQSPSDLEEIHEQLFTSAYRLRKPIVAGVHAPALAGGTGLVANAHIVVASEDATFGLPEVRIGLWPVLVYRALKIAMGERRATELSLTARIFNAKEAQSYGLVHEISPSPQARAAEIARQISQFSPDGIRAGLDYVNQIRDLTWDEAGRSGKEIRRTLTESPYFKEAIRKYH